MIQNIGFGGEEATKGLYEYEYEGPIASLVTVVEKQWNVRARENVVDIIHNIAAGGAKLSERLYEFPELMANLERAKKRRNAAAKKRTVETIKLICKHKTPTWHLMPTPEEVKKERIAAAVAAATAAAATAAAIAAACKELSVMQKSLARFESFLAGSDSSLPGLGAVTPPRNNKRSVDQFLAENQAENDMPIKRIRTEKDEEIKRIRAENEDLRKQLAAGNTEKEVLQDQAVCIICYEKPRSCLFSPCSHMVTCEKCSNKVEECPVCCYTITNRSTV